jgi:hypothetical protein
VSHPLPRQKITSGMALAQVLNYFSPVRIAVSRAFSGSHSGGVSCRRPAWDRSSLQRVTLSCRRCQSPLILIRAQSNIRNFACVFCSGGIKAACSLPTGDMGNRTATRQGEQAKEEGTPPLALVHKLNTTLNNILELKSYSRAGTPILVALNSTGLIEVHDDASGARLGSLGMGRFRTTCVYNTADGQPRIAAALSFGDLSIWSGEDFRLIHAITTDRHQLISLCVYQVMYETNMFSSFLKNSVLGVRVDMAAHQMTPYTPLYCVRGVTPVSPPAGSGAGSAPARPRRLLQGAAGLRRRERGAHRWESPHRGRGGSEICNRARYRRAAEGGGGLGEFRLHVSPGDGGGAFHHTRYEGTDSVLLLEEAGRLLNTPSPVWLFFHPRCLSPPVLPLPPTVQQSGDLTLLVSWVMAFTPSSAPDATHIISVADGLAIAAWDATNGRLVSVLRQRSPEAGEPSRRVVPAVVAAEEGALLAVSKGGREVELWGLESGALAGVLNFPGGGVHCVQGYEVSGGGARLAVGGTGVGCSMGWP